MVQGSIFTIINRSGSYRDSNDAGFSASEEHQCEGWQWFWKRLRNNDPGIMGNLISCKHFFKIYESVDPGGISCFVGPDAILAMSADC